MNEESIGISLDLVSRIDDFIMGSLKPRRQVERKTVIDFRHVPHHFVFLSPTVETLPLLNLVTMFSGHGKSKRSYVSRRDFYKDRFSSICLNVQF